VLAIALAVVAAAVCLRNGPSLRDYLALRRPPPGAIAVGLALTLGVGVVQHVGSLWFGEPIPAFVAHSYRTAGSPTFLVVAFVVCAPLSEEVVFRGFLLTGLATAYRTRTAVLVTAVIFAALHLGQYGLWELVSLAVFGALLAVARLRSGSLLVPIAMHGAMNLGALLGTAVYFHGTR
jgi:membrane protease YdiL (CAAX protease family)